MKTKQTKLIAAARQAMKNSYSPYSRYKVGAALMTSSGRVYAGTNVENASYGLTVCAERAALMQAVSEGYRNFTHLAVVCNGKRLPVPCGACLQVLNEFCTNLCIIVSHKNNVVKTVSLKELLPHAFTL